MKCGLGVLGQVLLRVFDAETHIGVCREVAYKIAAAHRGRESRKVEIVAANE
jgi:hypothetical protein